MTRLAAILRDHQAELFSLYGKHMQTVHHRAIKHILTCHTPACGEIHSQCEDCHQGIEQYPSCGNRFCPACQHRANGDWLSKQQQKLLPVDYYMVHLTQAAQSLGVAPSNVGVSGIV